MIKELREKYGLVFFASLLKHNILKARSGLNVGRRLSRNALDVTTLGKSLMRMRTVAAEQCGTRNRKSCSNE